VSLLRDARREPVRLRARAIRSLGDPDAMSDVIAAALIAGCVSVIGNFVTLGVARITTATERGRLEEEGRTARREAYLAFLNQLEELDLFASGYTDPPSYEAFSTWLVAFRSHSATVSLVESPSVNEARRDVLVLVDDLGERMGKYPPNAAFEDRLGEPYVEMRDRFSAAGTALQRAMRDDLGLSSQ
jgi:hypothetical protein